MSSVDVGTAFVRVVPDSTGFRALLQTQVNAAVAGVVASVPVVTAAAAGSVGGSTATASAVAASNLAQVEKASRGAARGLDSASTQSKLLQGSVIGLSRITPVAVFGLGLYGSAAIGAGLAIKSAITSAADFEQQLNTFGAVTGATADQMERVSQRARELGSDVSLPAISAGDAAVAMTELAKAGLSVNDTLAASEGVLQLASAANIDAGTAAQIAATQLNAFQLAGSKATDVAELLADASISAQGEITDFAAGFAQVSAVANQVGLSIEDTTALLTQLGKAGLRGADGGTSLRTALLRLVPTTKEAAQFQEALGIQIDKTKSIGDQIVPLIEQYRVALAGLTPVQQQLTLTQIFGQDAIRAASIIFGQQQGALSALTDEFERSNAIQDLSAAKAEGLKGAFGGLKSNLETVGTQLGLLVQGPLEGLVEKASIAVGGIGDLVTGLEKLATVEIPPIEIPLVFGITLPGGSAADAFGEFRGTFGPGGPEKLASFIASQGANALDQISKIINENTPGSVIKIPRRADASKATQEREGEEVAKLISGDSFVHGLERGLKAEQIQKRIEALTKGALLDSKSLTPGEQVVALAESQRFQTPILEAQLSGNLQAELAADRVVENFLKERLSLAKKGSAAYLIIQQALVSAHNNSQSVLNEINQESEQRGRDQKRAAEEAIAIERKRAAEQEQLRQTILDIQTQRLGNRLAVALRTEGTDDEKGVFGQQIAFLKKQKQNAEAIANTAKNGSQAQADARKQVEVLNGQIIDIRTKIMNLGKKASGASSSDSFSLQDLFQEAVNQFKEFGSNVSSSVVTGGGARAAVAGGILAQRPQDAKDAFGRAVAQNTQEQLNKAATTNELLTGILIAVSGGRTTPASRGGTSPGETSFEQARRLGRTVRAF